MDSPDRQSRSNVTVALVLIGVGAFFLIVQIFDIRLGIEWWPLLFLLPGLAMVGLGFSRRPVNSGLAVGGGVLATLGAIFLYQSASNNWESWTYIWTLFPLVSGVILMAAGNTNGDEPMARSGAESARWGAIAFVVGVVIFEVFIFGGLIGYIIPVVLIAIGAFILWSNNGGRFAAGPFFGGSDAAGAETRQPTPPPAPAPPASTVQPPPPAAIVPAAPPPEPGALADVLEPEPFPADDLPEPPPADDAPFPPDEEAAVPAKSTRAGTQRSRSRRSS